MENEIKKLVKEEVRGKLPLENGSVYSRRKGLQPFDVPSIENYVPIMGEEKMEELQKLAAKLKGVKILEVNSTAMGGGVAEMLYSQVPFLNQLGLEDEWKVMSGRESFYRVTKSIHNLLQGKKGGEKIIRLLENPHMAKSVGEKAHNYIREHFLMPDGVADYLRIFNYFTNGELDRDAIISYHPWFKLSKREVRYCYPKGK